MQTIIVIPAYNEGQTIGEVVRQISMIHDSKFMIQTIVIDDGSTDQTAQVAQKAGALVLRHPLNRGLGAALSTGIEAALVLLRHPEGVERLKDPELKGTGFFIPNAFEIQNDSSGVIVTLDADRQHSPPEIPRLLEPIVKGEADVVIGSRFIKSSNHQIIKSAQPIPWHRRIANFCGNFFTWLLFGIWVSDSQSGFRAFSANAASELRLRTSTMEVSSEIIREIARLKLRLIEVPITVKYTEYSLAKGQGFFRGLITLWKLIILKFFR